MSFGVCVVECMCAQARPQIILSSERVLRNGDRTHINSKGKSPLYWRLRGGLNMQRCITQDSKPNILSTGLCHTSDLKIGTPVAILPGA